MEKKIIICAGNYEQFMNYLNDNGLTTEKAVYGSAHSMMGVQAEKVEVIGTFWDRKDAHDAYEMALSRVF